MSAVLKLVQNDTGPNRIIPLIDKASGLPIDLTGATLALKWRAKNTTVLLLTTGMTLTITGAPTLGIITLGWGAVALVNPPGWYEGEIEITQGGQLVSVYDMLNVYLRADV